jgi:hypothetical protein
MQYTKREGLGLFGPKLEWRSNGERPMSRRLIFAISVVLAVASTGLAPGLAAQEREGADLGPGCAPDRPAIAHHSGGITLPTQGKEPPIPCVTATGFHTSEVSIVVTNAGTILLRPAWQTDTTGMPMGAIRSVDRGASWEMPQTQTLDTNMWVDRQTGRVFWIACGGHCPISRFEISDDDGKTWFPGGTILNFDHVQVFGGPPTEKLKHLMKGYPNVVYACMGHKPLKCEKSLDGGMTWGPELDIPYPPGLEAIQGPAHDCSAFGLQGVVGMDGTVYVPYGPCNRPYLAISHDEGHSWQLVAVANTEFIGYGYPTLGIDEQENLYAGWVGASDRLPYLAISRDHGLHWGTPLNIGAPGVNEAALPYLVTGTQGQVAITYYGSKNAPLPFPPVCYPRPLLRPAWETDVTPAIPPQMTPSSTCPGYEQEKWDTYVTESWNVLESQPLFWSATLNDPAQPTWYGCSPSEMGVVRMDEDFNAGPGQFRGCSPAVSRFDYYGATIARDGTVWVGFAQECPFGRPVPGNPNCPSTLTGTAPDGLWGLVGRLVPQAEYFSTPQQKTSGMP